jgi:hypothetical protein
MSEAPLSNDAPVVAPPLRRHAVVVGVNISPYSGLGALTCAEYDAEQMSWVLGSVACSFSVTPLSGEKATSSAVQSTIRSLIRAHQHPDDFLLFYFSGHGRYVGDDVYLVTSDFDPGDIALDRDAHLSISRTREVRGRMHYQ